MAFMKMIMASPNMPSSVSTVYVLLVPLDPSVSNVSAWQQPFWERISTEHGRHGTLLNFEMSYTDTKIHITNAKAQTFCDSCPCHYVYHSRSIYQHAGNWRSSSDLGKIQPHRLNTLDSEQPHTLIDMLTSSPCILSLLIIQLLCSYSV